MYISLKFTPQFRRNRQKERCPPGCRSSACKNSRRVCLLQAAKSLDHFLSRPVGERKYVSGCKCGIFPHRGKIVRTADLGPFLKKQSGFLTVSRPLPDGRGLQRVEKSFRRAAQVFETLKKFQKLLISMVRDTLLGFPSHTLPYRYRKSYHFICNYSRQSLLQPGRKIIPRCGQLPRRWR